MKDTNKLNPEIRFSGFTDDWEQRKLNEVSNIYDGTHQTPKYQDDGVMFLSVENIKTLTSNKFISREAFEDEFKIRPQRGDVLMTRIGDIGTANVVETDEDLAYYVSLALFKSEELNPYFLQASIYAPFVQDQIWERTLHIAFPKKINKNEIGQVPINVPTLEEQTKIGSFFKQLDDTITLHQRKLNGLKNVKKAMLEKMFPKNGESVPEIRFSGFTDDWEQRKLSSGLREYTDRVIVEDDKEYYQISVRNNFGGITLRGSKMGNKIGRKRQAKINLTKYPQTLIFTRQTVEQGGIGWVEKYCDGAIVTENMPTISLDTSVFSKYFLTNLFQTKIFYKNAILDNIEGGSAQIAIHESKFLSSTLLFPNLDEQEKIGSFFKQLDDTITLHQRKLDKLKTVKKAMLEKMFI